MVAACGSAEGGGAHHPRVPGAAGGRVRQPGADLRQLVRALQPVLAVGQEQLPSFVEGGAVADADQHVLEPMASGRGVVHLVGDDGR